MFGMFPPYVEEAAALACLQAGNSPKVAIRKGIEFTALLLKRYEQKRKERDIVRRVRQEKLDKIDKLIKEDKELTQIAAERKEIGKKSQANGQEISRIASCVRTRDPEYKKSIKIKEELETENYNLNRRDNELYNLDKELRSQKRARLMKRFKVKEDED